MYDPSSTPLVTLLPPRDEPNETQFSPSRSFPGEIAVFADASVGCESGVSYPEGVCFLSFPGGSFPEGVRGSIRGRDERSLHQHHQPLAPSDGGVQQISLQHRVVLRRDRDDKGRIFRSLALGS